MSDEAVPAAPMSDEAINGLHIVLVYYVVVD